MYKRAAAQTVLFKAIDSNDGTSGKTGLTSFSTKNIIKDGAAPAPLTNAPTECGGGWYLASLTTAEFTAESIGLDFGAAGAIIAPIVIHTEADYTAARAAFLDAAISSRGTSTYAGGAVASVTAAVTVGTNNDKSGYALSSAGVQAVWDALTSALSTVGSIGKRIADYLTGDAFARLGAPAGASIAADIATRSTYAGADTSGTTTLLSRLTSTRAVLMDNLDAAVSTRLASASYTAPPSAATNATAVRTELATELGRIDVATSTRLASGTVASDVTAIKAKTDNLPSDPADASDIAGAFSTVNGTLSTIAGYIDTEVGAIKAKTDLIPASPAAVSDIPSAAVIADAVWDEALSGHAGAGSAGEALSAASSGGSAPSASAIADEVQTRTIAAVTVVNGLAANTLTAAALATDAVTEIQSGLAAASVLAAVKTKTDNLPAAPASSGDVSTVGAAVAAVDAKVGTPAGASVSADLAAVKTDTAAVKTKTDPLTFTIANKVDANIRAVNDVNVTGSGAPSDPWGP